jgi:peptidoglycan/xylan/chitin deacetylase (PgdA/CDA1 family)
MRRRALVIRFDDITPTSNWLILDAAFEVCDRYGIKPLLAVVPDNHDPKLVIQNARTDFWKQMLSRQAQGWGIGIHGLHHVYETSNSGIVGINNRSEWAGVAYQTQLFRLREALEIFSRHRLQPDAWVAPAHSFDLSTCVALREVGINTISDGYFPAPTIDRLGLRWIPCQGGSLPPWPWGLWTIALHVDAWSDKDLARFEDQLKLNAGDFIAWSDALNWHPRLPWWFAHGICSRLARMARILSHGFRWAIHHHKQDPKPACHD